MDATTATATANHLAAARKALASARTDAERGRLQVLVGNLAWLVSTSN